MQKATLLAQVHRLYQSVACMVDELDGVGWKVLQQVDCCEQAWYVEKVQGLDDLAGAIAIWLDRQHPTPEEVSGGESKESDCEESGRGVS